MAERAFRVESTAPLIVAHRGASSSVPENTLEAFEAAVRAGAGAVELDVRLTADGVPVVMHDPDVDRTTGGTGRVHELPLSSVRELDAGSGTGTRMRVPLLFEALELLSARAGIMIELKNNPGDPGHVPDAEPHVDASLEALRATAFRGPVMIASFNPSSIAHARAMWPELWTGLLTHPMLDPWKLLPAVAEAGHRYLLPGVDAVLAAGPDLVAEAHDRGVLLGAWVVDDPHTLRRLTSWGIDAIATNDPASAVGVVRRSGGRET